MRSMSDTSSSNKALAEEEEEDVRTNIPAPVLTIHLAPKVVRNATFESTTSAEETDGELQFTTNKIEARDIDNVCHNDKRDEDDDIVDRHRGSDFRRTSSTRVETLDCSLFSSWEDIVAHVFYVSTFAVFGTVARSYIGRIFGLDCIRNELDDFTYTDFLTPLSEHICITSDGKTQRGGAIFIDLPANMIGS